MAQPESAATGTTTGTATGTRLANAGGSRWRRLLGFTGLSLLLVLALIVADVIALALGNPVRALSPHYYMALGNSLSFGYQPNLDFSSGFADDIFNHLRTTGVSAIVNDACAGETTETMIQGGCVGRFAHKGSYTGPQLQAAVDFLSKDRNRGRISPITLEIGANDVLPDWDAAACIAGPNADTDLARMDTNLTDVILPALRNALTTPSGAEGDLHLLNYYNPFARACPDSAPFVHKLNDHLQADAAKFRIPVVDVYTAFGGDAGMSDNICKYTWYCTSFHDIHPTNEGYAKIAQAVELTLGLPGTNPLPGIGMPAGSLTPPHTAAVWRRLALR